MEPSWIELDSSSGSVSVNDDTAYSTSSSSSFPPSAATAGARAGAAAAAREYQQQQEQEQQEEDEEQGQFQLPRTGSPEEDGFQALLAKTKQDLDDLKQRLQAAKMDHVPTPSPRVHRKFEAAA